MIRESSLVKTKIKTKKKCSNLWSSLYFLWRGRKPKGNFRSRLINAQNRRTNYPPTKSLYLLSGERASERLGGCVEVLRKSLQRFCVDRLELRIRRWELLEDSVQTSNPLKSHPVGKPNVDMSLFYWTCWIKGLDGSRNSDAPDALGQKNNIVVDSVLGELWVAQNAPSLSFG